MKSEQLYKELEKNLPAGFVMNTTCKEYLSNEFIYYPCATKMTNFHNGYYYNFLKLFIENDGIYLLYNQKRRLCKSKDFRKIAAVIKGVV